MKPEIDALIRGKIGSTDTVREARIVRVSPFGWVAGIDTEGHQVIMYTFEIIGPPRPAMARRDIPERFR